MASNLCFCLDEINFAPVNILATNCIVHTSLTCKFSYNCFSSAFSDKITLLLVDGLLIRPVLTRIDQYLPVLASNWAIKNWLKPGKGSGPGNPYINHLLATLGAFHVTRKRKRFGLEWDWSKLEVFPITYHLSPPVTFDRIKTSPCCVRIHCSVSNNCCLHLHGITL